MKNVEDKNMHAGHRGRLLETVCRAGLDTLSEIQQMEFILFYIFPRGDTNPLVHRLLDKFGNVASVLEADENELTSVYGVGERAAKMLKQLVEIFFVYTTCKRTKRENLEEYTGIYDYCEQLLRFKTVEELYIVGVDCMKNIIGRRKLASGSINMVGITPLQISNFLASTKAAMVFITHNHPGGAATPSGQDKSATEYLSNLCATLGVTFIDHILIGEDGVYSFTYHSKVREFF